LFDFSYFYSVVGLTQPDDFFRLVQKADNLTWLKIGRILRNLFFKELSFEGYQIFNSF